MSQDSSISEIEGDIEIEEAAKAYDNLFDPAPVNMISSSTSTLSNCFIL